MIPERHKFQRLGLLAMRADAWGAVIDERGAAPRPFLEEGDAAFVDIAGPLIRKAVGFLALFCDDYESICSRARAAFASGQRRVILRISSPGGDASGCFELARELRALSVASGKPLQVFGQGMIASAAFAIACAATAGISVEPTCDVGSIGVFEKVIDWTAASAASGLRVVIVASGPEKTDRNPDVAISEEALARVQEHVDAFAGLFFDLCAELRGGSPEDYRKLGGGIFLGARALGVGLADSVRPWSDLLKEGPEIKTMPAQASKGYEEAIASLRKAAEKDDDEGKRAKRMLRAELDDVEKKDEGKADDSGGEPDGDEAKRAKAEEDEKMAKAEEEKKDEQAKASTSLSAEDVRRIYREEARASAESAERDALLNARPDLGAKLRASLAKLSVADVKLALEDVPKRAILKPAAASAAMPSLQGDTQGDGSGYSAEEGEIERAMSRSEGASPRATVF